MRSLVKKMHPTTQSTRTARIVAEKFGHTGIGAGSAEQRMGMIAIGGDKIIVEPNSRDRAGHDRLLADVKMTKAADFLGLILLAGALFKTPNEQHQPEHLDFVALLPRLHGNQAARATATSPLARVD